MTAENRKPLIILAVCCLAAVLVLALSVGLGRRAGDVDGWQQRLVGVVSPAVLGPTDLQLSDGQCAAEDAYITVVGRCTFTVPKSGGAFSVTGVTRQAKLSAPGMKVEVAVTLDGQIIKQTLTAGDAPLRLTFGRDGGTLELLCVAGPCVVAFAEGDS